MSSPGDRFYLLSILVTRNISRKSSVSSVPAGNHSWVSTGSQTFGYLLCVGCDIDIDVSSDRVRVVQSSDDD